jgi:hypothetical protein
MSGGHDQIDARRMWLPWPARFRLIVAYPRCWHWVYVRLDRFDAWFTGRYRGRWYWPALLTIVFLVFVAVRFLALVAVLEITIVAFAASIYLVWGEWTLLLLLFPLMLIARIVRLRPWPLIAHNGSRRWRARVTGWRAAGQSTTVAVQALNAGREPPGTTWTETARRSRFWI